MEVNLAVIGGISSSGEVLDDLLIFGLHPYGRLSEPIPRTISRGVHSPVVITSKGNITVAGGYREADALPVGSAYLQHGNHLYLIGGRTPEGEYSDRILTRRVSEEQWRETVPLPQPLAYSSAFIIGSRLFVIGGENETGQQDIIYRTHIHSNGDLGFVPIPWSVNPIRLPYPISRSASAVHDGRIYLIGGETPSGTSDSIIHARISPKSTVGQWYHSPHRLPEPRSLPGAAVVYSENEAITVEQDHTLPAAGPWHTREQGGIRAISRDEKEKDENLKEFQVSTTEWIDAPDILFLEIENIEPQVPEVYPGTGVIGRGSVIRFRQDPGTETQYSTDRITWRNVTSLGSINSPDELWFRSVRGESTSPELQVTYRTQSLGFTLPISGSLSVNSSGEYQELDLRGPSQWMTLSVGGDDLLLSIKDESSGEYTASVEITLYEHDLLTEALDASGQPVSGIPSSDQVHLSLQRGTYTMQIRGTGTMGISIKPVP